MTIPEPYHISIFLLIVSGTLFAALVLLHICRDQGFYDQHKEVEGRRQPYQKVELNLKFSQNIHLPFHEAKIPDPVKVQHIPLKSVKFEEITFVECH
jgi:hypothetical protein